MGSPSARGARARQARAGPGRAGRGRRAAAVRDAGRNHARNRRRAGRSRGCARPGPAPGNLAEFADLQPQPQRPPRRCEGNSRSPRRASAARSGTGRNGGFERGVEAVVPGKRRDLVQALGCESLDHRLETRASRSGSRPSHASANRSRTLRPGREIDRVAGIHQAVVAVGPGLGAHAVVLLPSGPR